MRALARTVDRLAAAALAVSAVAVAVMAVLVTVEVLVRSFAGISTLVADEMAGYLLVVVTFFGLADSMKAGAFIRVEFLDTWLSPAGRRLTTTVLLAVALAYTLLLGWHFWLLVAQSYRFGSTSLQVSRTPLWIPQACAAVGTSILALQIATLIGGRLGRDAVE